MDIVKQLAQEIPGLETEAELEALYKAVADCKPMVAIEIGCLFGLSSSVIAEAMQGNGKLICIDNFAVQGSDTRPYFIEKTLPRYPIINLMEMDSTKAAHEFFEMVDFIFIDGDHQDDGILRDLKNWLPKMKPGATVAFHDYFNTDFPSIRRRVEEFTAGFPVIAEVDSLMIKRLP